MNILEDTVVFGQVQNALEIITFEQEVFTALNLRQVTLRFPHNEIEACNAAAAIFSTKEIFVEPENNLWWPLDEGLRLAWAFIIAAHELRHLYPCNNQLWQNRPKLAELDCDWFAAEMYAVCEHKIRIPPDQIPAMMKAHLKKGAKHPPGMIRAWAFRQGYFQRTGRMIP